MMMKQPDPLLSFWIHGGPFGIRKLRNCLGIRGIAHHVRYGADILVLPHRTVSHSQQ